MCYRFDVTSKYWRVFPVEQDIKYTNDIIGCVQYPQKSNLVYFFGNLFKNVWTLNMDNLHLVNLKWEISNNIDLHSPTVTVNHSSLINQTSFGQIYYYNSQTTTSISFGWKNEDFIIKGWITIPKLKYICWEAMIHYFKDQMFLSSDEQLKKIGIPKEFFKRIIDARRQTRI